MLESMRCVRIIPSTRLPLYAPRITICARDGRSCSRQARWREFIWDLEEETRRIRGITGGIPVFAAGFEEVISACRNLFEETWADPLIRLRLRA